VRTIEYQMAQRLSEVAIGERVDAKTQVTSAERNLTFCQILIVFYFLHQK